MGNVFLCFTFRNRRDARKEEERDATVPTRLAFPSSSISVCNAQPVNYPLILCCCIPSHKAPALATCLDVPKISLSETTIKFGV